jgi:hypothetical protein
MNPGRHGSEWLAGIVRNGGPACFGIGGRHAPESAFGIMTAHSAILKAIPDVWVNSFRAQVTLFEWLDVSAVRRFS